MTSWIARPDPVQPIEFPHNMHVGKQIGCTEYCHESVTTGPVAGLPSVRTCMICHNAIATDRPRIKQITAMREKGIDLAWQRVYGYHARGARAFNHAPHIRAKVECSTCHGDIGAADGRAAQRRSEHGLLRELPQEKQGVERLPDLSLLRRLMDRRSFIKLTAITGTSAALASCGNPENQLIRFVPDEDIVPGQSRCGSRACARCARPAAG